jgi:hypothetical protein
MQIFIYCQVALHISSVTTPFTNGIKTINAFTVTATSLQRGLIRLRFITPDDGCCDTRNIQSVSAVNKYLHTVASIWIFVNIEL